MKIHYPPLVEQGIDFFNLKAADQQQMYQLLVEADLITETGMPTQAALDAGLIKEYTESEDLTFADFLKLYPVFVHYDRNVFCKIAGFWEIPVSLKQEILADLATNQFTYDEKNDLLEYLSDRS